MICPECNGKGKSIYYVETGRDENTIMVKQRKGICRTCNGSGKKQQTNADRIRAMSDEELADFLTDKYVMESCLRLKDEGYEPTETQKKAIKHTLYCTWIKWLKQPVE